MKLIWCEDCLGLINLQHIAKSCPCGHCSGKYLDKTYVEVFGPCRVVGFGTSSFVQALNERPPYLTDRGRAFKAFIIEELFSETILRRTKKIT